MRGEGTGSCRVLEVECRIGARRGIHAGSFTLKAEYAYSVPGLFILGKI